MSSDRPSTAQPVAPSDDSGRRTILKKLSAALLKTHKLLIDLEAAEAGHQGNPYQLLGLLTNDPRFAWLRAFSQLIVDMDERRTGKAPVTVAQVGAYRRKVEEIVGPLPATEQSGRARYETFLARDAAVKQADHALHAVLEKMPTQFDA
tara:strand:+ start:2264 stop:2710 length:447 start_codon:yes stop_codon:yes gene_type:complete